MLELTQVVVKQSLSLADIHREVDDILNCLFQMENELHRAAVDYALSRLYPMEDHQN